jgi:uncharacterized membrane protein YccF (DUF307 family)
MPIHPICGRNRDPLPYREFTGRRLSHPLCSPYSGPAPVSGATGMTPLIRLILNILWFIFGGWLSGLLWLLGGAILALTIVGLPWTFAAWRIASYSFWPFGREVVWRDELGEQDAGTGPLGLVLNIIWFIFAGWYIALSHLLIAVAEFITIIGIPFALKDLELAKLALAPIGRTIRDKP